jgi:dUTP pyrophosphatase
MNIKYKRFDKKTKGLEKKRKDDAGFDLFARLKEDLTIYPNEVVKIPMNVAVDLPENMFAIISARSSTYKNFGLKMTNSLGIIDSSYRGDDDEWMIEFKNESDMIVKIVNGDKLAQAVFFKLPHLEFEEVEKLSENNRGGFGTSGRR